MSCCNAVVSIENRPCNSLMLGRTLQNGTSVTCNEPSVLMFLASVEQALQQLLLSFKL